MLALAAIGLIALTGPSSAHALGIASFTAQPGSTQAGANTDFDIAMSFSDQADDVKDLTIGLPPGLVGNPTVAEICPVANLNADTCPAASLVGDVNTNASPLGLLPIDIPGNLYNIPANTGEPARFGIVLRPAGGLLEKVVMQSGAVLRPSDFGLNTVIEDIPNTSGGIPIDINSMTVSLKGQAGDPLGGFIRNPTSCVPAHAFLSVTSYADPDAPVSQDAAPFTPTGCDQVPFSPEFSAKVGAPGLTAENAHPPLTSVIEQSIDEAGLKLRPGASAVDPDDRPDSARGRLPGRPVSGRHLSPQHRDRVGRGGISATHGPADRSGHCRRQPQRPAEDRTGPDRSDVAETVRRPGDLGSGQRGRVRRTSRHPDRTLRALVQRQRLADQQG